MDLCQWDILFNQVVDRKNEDAVYNIVMPLYATSDYIIGVSERTKETVIKQLSEIGEYKLVEFFSQ